MVQTHQLNVRRGHGFGHTTVLSNFSMSAVLSRVQAFLPQLEASNKALLLRAQEDPSSVDIENVEEDEEHYIEMVLFTS